MRYTRRDVLLLAAHAGIGATAVSGSSSAAPAVDSPFLQHGFAPVLDELTVDDLPVRGALPREIAGTYLRNGPNPAYPPISYTYPFEGDGMVHGLTIENGRAFYRNRFVLTAGLRADRRAGRTIYGGLTAPIVPDPAFVAPDGDPGRFKNFANTSVIRHANRILALYEGGLPYELTPALETKGRYDFAGKVPDAMTAHPKFDPLTREMLMFRYSLTAPFLLFRVVDATGAVVREVPIDTPMPFMVHDFVFTARRVVFFLCPVVFDPEGAKSGKPFLAWRPERGTRIAVLSRDGTDDVRWFDDEAFFVYHFMNAHEAGHRITIDYVQHGAFFTTPGAPPALWRALIDLERGGVTRVPLDDRICEFPRIDGSRAGRVNRYGWLPVKTKQDGPGVFGALARHDFQTGSVAVREFGPGREIDEPVFVRRAGGGEGDGWIMVYVYDRASDGSVCAVLDAVDITKPPVAEIVMPRRIPHGLHGNWLAA